MAVAFISAIAAYGFGFFAGIQGIGLISVSQFISGIIWLLVCLLYLAMAIAIVRKYSRFLLPQIFNQSKY